MGSIQGKQDSLANKKQDLDFSKHKIFCQQSSKCKENCSIPSTNQTGSTLALDKAVHLCEPSAQKIGVAARRMSKSARGDTDGSIFHQKTRATSKAAGTSGEQMRSSEIFAAFGRTLPSPRLVSVKPTGKSSPPSHLRWGKRDQSHSPCSTEREKGRVTHCSTMKASGWR